MGAGASTPRRAAAGEYPLPRSPARGRPARGTSGSSTRSIMANPPPRSPSRSTKSCASARATACTGGATAPLLGRPPFTSARSPTPSTARCEYWRTASIRTWSARRASSSSGSTRRPTSWTLHCVLGGSSEGQRWGPNGRSTPVVGMHEYYTRRGGAAGGAAREDMKSGLSRSAYMHVCL